MTDEQLKRAAEIRARVEAIEAEHYQLMREYCTIFPAGTVDESDIAWARGTAELGAEHFGAEGK